jgi:hypothetical protein
LNRWHPVWQVLIMRNDMGSFRVLLQLRSWAMQVDGCVRQWGFDQLI